MRGSWKSPEGDRYRRRGEEDDCVGLGRQWGSGSKSWVEQRRDACRRQ